LWNVALQQIRCFPVVLVELVLTDILLRTNTRYPKRCILIRGSIVVVSDFGPSDFKYVRRRRRCSDGCVNIRGLSNEIVVRGQEVRTNDVLEASISVGRRGTMRHRGQFFFLECHFFRVRNLNHNPAFATVPRNSGTRIKWLRGETVANGHSHDSRSAGGLAEMGFQYFPSHPCGQTV